MLFFTKNFFITLKKYDKNFNFSVSGHQFFALETKTNLIFAKVAKVVAKVYNFIIIHQVWCHLMEFLKVFLIITSVRTFIKYFMSNILSKKYFLSIANRAFSIRWLN